MKTFFLLYIALAISLCAQNTPISPVYQDPNTKRLKDDLKVPSGKTATLEPGSTFRYEAGANFAGDATEFRADISATPDGLALSNSRLYEIKRWWKAIFDGKATLVVLGDSVGGLVPTPQYIKILREHGFGGYLGHNYALTSPEIYTGGASYFSGAISANDPSFVIWPTGQYYLLPAGSTITRPNMAIHVGYNWTATKLKVIYDAGPTRGVFKVQIARPGGAGYVDAPGASSVDATVGTGNKVLSIDLPAADAYDYRIVHVSGGTVVICESGFVNTSGVCIIDLWRGGLPLEYMVKWAAANAATVFGDAQLTPKLITVEVKDYWTDSTQLDAFETLLTNAGVSTSTDVCHILSSPEPSDAGIVLQNNITRAHARNRNRAVWDGYSLMETYAISQQNFGAPLNDIHGNAQWQNFRSNAWAQDVRLFGNALGPEATRRLGNVDVSGTISLRGRDVFNALRDSLGAAKAARGEVNFTGAGNFYIYGSAPTIGTSDFTWSAWVYLPRLGEAGATTNAGVFGFSSSSGTTAVASSLSGDYDPSGDEFRITLTNGTGMRRMRCNAFLATHGGGFRLMTVRRRAGVILLNIGRSWFGDANGYTNGIYSESTLGTTSPPAWSDTITATFMLVGRTQQHGVFRASEIAVWTRALADAEVNAYADTGVAPVSPAALYLCNERGGRICYDSSGNNLHLTHATAGMWYNARAELKNSASLDFPSLTTGSEATLTMTVTGATTTNTPTVLLGWSGALPDGIVVKQAWVSAADTVSVRVRNSSASTIDPAAVTCSATVTGL